MKIIITDQDKAITLLNSLKEKELNAELIVMELKVKLDKAENDLKTETLNFQNALIKYKQKFIEGRIYGNNNR